MDLRFYKFNFELLHIEARYISSNWTVYYNEIGRWEGHISLDSKAVPLIMNEKYLVVVQGENAAIITGKQATTDFAIYGRTCNWLLTRRTTPKFKENKGDVETLSRNYVSDAFSDTPELTLGDITGFDKEISFWRNTYNPTFDVVRDCLNNDNAGHRLKFDYIKNLWIYEVLKGEDISNILLISEANKNSFDTEITDDCLDYFNCGWYEQEYEDKGEYDASKNVPSLTNTSSDYFAHKYRVTAGGNLGGIVYKAEDYIACNNHNRVFEKISSDDMGFWVYISGSDEGIYRWETTLSGSTLSEAKTDLNNKKWNSFIKVKSDTLKLGADYNLGDIVSVQIIKGQYLTTKEKRIIGVNLWYEGSNIGEQPIFEEDV